MLSSAPDKTENRHCRRGSSTNNNDNDNDENTHVQLVCN